MRKNLLIVLAASIGINFLMPMQANAELVCRLCPFSCVDTGARDEDCGDNYMRRNGKCCVDLDNRGLDALKEHDRRQRGGYYPDQVSGGGYRPGSHHYDSGYDSNYRDRDGDYNDHGYNDHGYNDHGYGRPNRPSYDPRRTDPGAYDDRNGYQPGDCPAGYHVNERACTADERRRGCNDLRSRSGQTCVGWNQR